MKKLFLLSDGTNNEVLHQETYSRKGYVLVEKLEEADAVAIVSYSRNVDTLLKSINKAEEMNIPLMYLGRYDCDQQSQYLTYIYKNKLERPSLGAYALVKVTSISIKNGLLPTNIYWRSTTQGIKSLRCFFVYSTIVSNTTDFSISSLSSSSSSYVSFFDITISL